MTKVDTDHSPALVTERCNAHELRAGGEPRLIDEFQWQSCQFPIRASRAQVEGVRRQRLTLRKFEQRCRE